jgi:hypothetical protein
MPSVTSARSYARFDQEWRVISTQQTELLDGPAVTGSYEGGITPVTQE